MPEVDALVQSPQRAKALSRFIDGGGRGRIDPSKLARIGDAIAPGEAPPEWNEVVRFKRSGPVY